MTLELASLPTEVLHQTLTYLPIPSLLAFGRTSRYHRELSTTAFLRLRIGVFPSQINCMLSLLDDLEDDNVAQSVQILLERKRNRTKGVVVHNQNRTISKILSQHGRNLRDLEISFWTLENPLAKTLSSLTMLRHLSIRMDHPHTRYSDVPLSFWKTSAPSAAWNWLYSNPTNPIRPLGRLQTLRLERAGITTYQLRRLLESNPRITKLRLRKCLSLGEDFWAWLAKSRFASQLKVLHFTHSANEEVDNRVLDHLDAFTALESLSLLACPHIDDDEVSRRNEESWKFPHCTLPSCSPSPTTGCVVEVDPAYK